MFNIERQEEILKILEIKRCISVKKLSEMLYVSAPTIRRDLSILENQGKVKRTHGGVVLRHIADSEIPLMLREDQNGKSKEVIAKKAIGYVKNGDVIFLDASSTAAHIVPFLKKFNDIIVVTNSPKTSISLGEANIKNYCAGGLLLPHSITYVGNETVKFVEGINADVFFFSSRGYLENGYITDSSIEEVTVKKAMIKNAKRTFCLCDSSKNNKMYMYNVCKTNEIDGIISEE